MTADAPTEHGLGTRALRGMVWAYTSYVGGRLLILLSTAVLARILVPEQFGLVALALTFMALLDGVSDIGLSQALVIQPDDRLYDRAETVFVSSVVLGLVLSLIVAAISPLMASAFGQPALVGIGPVLGANFFLRSLGSTHYALAQRSLNFRARTVAEFADVLVRGPTGIVLALAGMGAWSLVIGYLVGTVALVVTIWQQIRWRPKLTPHWADLRTLARFGGTLSAVDVVASVIANVDYLFVGGVLGTTALGLYTLGFRLPELLILNLSVVAGRVLYPAFAAADDLGRAFLISLRYTLIVSLPIAVVLVVLAEPFIRVAFGAQWLGSVSAMRILTIYAFAISLGIPPGTVIKATGRAGILLKLAIFRLVAVVVGLVLFTHLGIAAVASTQAVVAVLAEGIILVIVTRLVGVGVATTSRTAWPALVAATAMAVPTIAIDHLVSSPLASLVLAGLGGAAAYLAALALVAPDALRYLGSRISRVRRVAPDTLETVRETDVIA